MDTSFFSYVVIGFLTLLITFMVIIVARPKSGDENPRFTKFTLSFICLMFINTLLVSYLQGNEVLQENKVLQEKVDLLTKTQQVLATKLQGLTVVKDGSSSIYATKQDDLAEIKRSIEKTNKYLENVEQQPKNIEKMALELQNMQAAIGKIEDKLGKENITLPQQSNQAIPKETFLSAVVLGFIASLIFIISIRLRQYFEKDAEIDNLVSSLYKNFSGK